MAPALLHDLVVDALGDRTYPFALQLGAGDGALTARLAPRCGRLIALEADPARSEAARRRLAAVPNVDVRRGAAPADVPRWTFDLVVCADVLDAAGAAAVLGGLDAVMPRGATLLAVHGGSRAGAHAVLRGWPGLVRVGGAALQDHALDRFERRGSLGPRSP